MYRVIILPHAQQFKCFVYRNLTHDCWSVKALEGEYKGRVVYHAQSLMLGSDIEFRVSESGRQRVIREKRKNVHAGVVGYPYHAASINLRYPNAVPANNVFECRGDYDPSNDTTTEGSSAYRAITYNPYKYDRFVFMDDLSEATITDQWDQSVILDPDGKVYIMSVSRLSSELKKLEQ